MVPAEFNDFFWHTFNAEHLIPLSFNYLRSKVVVYIHKITVMSVLIWILLFFLSLLFSLEKDKSN